MHTQTEKIDTMRDLFYALDDEFVSPLDRVQLLRMISDTALSTLRQAVPEATRNGASWSQIGKLLGMTKQAAWEQYH